MSQDGILDWNRYVNLALIVKKKVCMSNPDIDVLCAEWLKAKEQEEGAKAKRREIEDVIKELQKDIKDLERRKKDK